MIYVGIDIAKLSSFDKSSLIIGLESTAHYGNNLLAFLVPKGFQVSAAYAGIAEVIRQATAQNIVKNFVTLFLNIKYLLVTWISND